MTTASFSSLAPVAITARWVHVTSSVLLLLPLGAHLGIVFGHHFGLKDRLISRMLSSGASRRP